MQPPRVKEYFHPMLEKVKPLGRKAYGSIGHLPGSRLGPGDRHVPEGQALICTTKARDKNDVITVSEKLDGSCCAVAKIEGKIVALTRAGYLASTSPYEQHWLFAAWVLNNAGAFNMLLNEGGRIVGEWVAQAHGTMYPEIRWPFWPFDYFDENNGRLAHGSLDLACVHYFFPRPTHVHTGPISPEDGMLALMDNPDRPNCHPAPEGLVYRVERNGKVDFLAKWVRPDKEDGTYLPEVSGCPPVWNWGPKA